MAKKLIAFVAYFIPPGRTRQEQNTDRIMVYSFIAMFIAGVFLFILDLSLNLLTVGLLVLTLPFGAIGYAYMQRVGKIRSSRWLSHLHVLAVILFTGFVYSKEIRIHAYFLPILINILSVFRGKLKKDGYVLAGLILLSIPLLVYSDFRIMAVTLDEATMKSSQISNLMGATLVTCYEVIALLEVNSRYQQSLEKRNHEIEAQQQKLLQLMDTRDQLIRVLANDIRSPFKAILGTINVMELSQLTEEERNWMLKVVRRDAEGTLDMMDNLINWTKLQHNGLTPDPEWIRADSLLNTELFHLEKRAEYKKIRLDISRELNLLIYADRFLLEAVLHNLLCNAIKFTPEGGTATLKIILESGAVHFTVSDTGKGIAPDILQKIREGVPVSTDGTAHEKGHGVGLLVAGGMLELLGSRLNIQTSSGKGTTFHFVLAQDTNSSHQAVQG